MRILILGGDGMLGHQLLRQLRPRHDVSATLRKPLAAYASYDLFGADCFGGIEATSFEQVRACVNARRPQVIINAIGLVKQRPSAKDCADNLYLNAVFPQRLAYLAGELGARLIHFSTDCVFSGRKGNYTEEDFPDADDLYGQSKLLGEVRHPHALTLRTSIIGRELSRKTSLVEWFLAQRDSVQGYTRAIYTGFTTLEMARIVERLMTEYPHATGVWHVASERISKYDLLCLVGKHFKLETQIVPTSSFACDRSLVSDRFRAAFRYTPPRWDKMVAELAMDDAFYR
jgi:dTDP-4-dehydrorhamnose reductase